MDDKNIREPLTVEEVDRLCNACSNFKEKLIIWVLLDTGMRVSEFHDLKAENIMWFQSAIRIKSSKSKKPRVVHMTQRVKTLLEHYFALNDNVDMCIRQIQRTVKKLANRARINRDVTPHVLRHTFATLALQKNVSLAAVQKALGHASIKTTEIYLNYTDEHTLSEFRDKF
ncbi:tyrosine-type recombinase/integrase [Francisellaceae bacterium CB299]